MNSPNRDQNYYRFYSHCCSLQGRCTRENCKYLHPPPHLKTQLEINGRNTLATQKMLQNLQNQQLQQVVGMTNLQLQPSPNSLLQGSQSMPAGPGVSHTMVIFHYGPTYSWSCLSVPLENYHVDCFCFLFLFSLYVFCTDFFSMFFVFLCTFLNIQFMNYLVMDMLHFILS